jgi:predicted RND superfamily exporter protein
MRFVDSSLSVEPTGYGVLMVEMERHLVESQVQSVAVAFVVVFLMLAAMIKSARVGFLAMLPNLLPVAVGLGLMPLLGISLNPGSVMVAAVALGIVVDDTAHLLVAMRRKFADTSDLAAALQGAITEIGGQLTLTSLVLIGSMMVLALGSFAPSVHFGIITMSVVFVALLANLLLLPRLLCIADARRRLLPRIKT